MEIRTSELTGKALDYAVALTEGVECDEHNEPIWFDADGLEAPRVTYSPSTNWAHGGPIVDRADIRIRGIVGGYSAWTKKTVPRLLTGPTMLVAAMRAHVFAELGEEVDIPEWLV